MFGGSVAGEEVVGGEFGELDGVVDEGEQTSTPSAPWAVAPNRCKPGKSRKVEAWESLVSWIHA